MNIWRLIEVTWNSGLKEAHSEYRQKPSSVKAGVTENFSKMVEKYLFANNNGYVYTGKEIL